MITPITDQIKAIRKARTLTESPNAWKQINLADTSAGLNDAGATLVAVNMALKSFINLPDKPQFEEQRKNLAYEFFQQLQKANIR
jgi:hypothetical protein